MILCDRFQAGAHVSGFTADVSIYDLRLGNHSRKLGGLTLYQLLTCAGMQSQKPNQGNINYKLQSKGSKTPGGELSRALVCRLKPQLATN